MPVHQSRVASLDKSRQSTKSQKTLYNSRTIAHGQTRSASVVWVLNFAGKVAYPTVNASLNVTQDGVLRMYPESIPIGSYTHLNFAFAFIDPSTFKVAPMNKGDPKLYKRFTGLKSLYPDLQTWISIGGWSMNDADQPTATTFSDLAASKSAQKKFFDSLLSFMETYNFDGVDIDWEYPVAEERSGKKEDYDNFTSLLQNLRNFLSSSGKKYGLTITVPSSYWYLRHFDIAKMEKTIDWFNVMSYDLHGTWDNDNRWTGPYVRAHTNLTEINTSLELLWRNNIDPAKVVLGLGFYGRSFTLQDPSCKKPGCVFSAGGNAGQCTNA
ncbi:hypothetical protein KEM54_006393, partial [Ascosphaera aggregata]